MEFLISNVSIPLFVFLPLCFFAGVGVAQVLDW